MRRPTLTPLPIPVISLEPFVEPDPDFRDKLARARVVPFAWNTDFSRHTVEYDEIFSGGVPRDGIPVIRNPAFTNPEAADQWLDVQEPVIVLEIGGDASAYPLQILTYHEIVNDQVGGVAVAIAFCPLCNSAVAFERTLEGITCETAT